MAHDAGGARMSVDVIVERVRAAAESKTALRIAGCGTWLNAGRPVRAAETLSLAAHSGVVDYVPGDLTLTARAGTSLADIGRVTGAERQWLTLDPFGDSRGTIGATVATGSAGPLAHAFGGPRDHVLGLEAVTGSGARVRTGGRVVKNVAGFDLTRLFTGAWGTLAVITEVTVRLRGMPEVDETVAIDVSAVPSDVQSLFERVRALRIVPLALELVSAEHGATLLVRLAGNADAVRAQRRTLETVGALRDAETNVWEMLRTREGTDSAVLRLSRAPACIGEVWRVAQQCGSSAMLGASLGRGIVRCAMPMDSALADRVIAAARDAGVTVVGERLPTESWRSLPSPVADRLSVDVRQAFDPARVLNPGILGEAS